MSPSSTHTTFALLVFVDRRVRILTLSLRTHVRDSLRLIARDTIHSGSIIKPKPHPDALNLIIKKWCFKSDEVIMVGDSLQDDIMAANLAKCKSCWIDTGIDNATGRGEEGKPDWVVERIGDVERVIDDYNKNN